MLKVSFWRKLDEHRILQECDQKKHWSQLCIANDFAIWWQLQKLFVTILMLDEILTKRIYVQYLVVLQYSSIINAINISASLQFFSPRTYVTYKLRTSKKSREIITCENWTMTIMCSCWKTQWFLSRLDFFWNFPNSKWAQWS